MEGAMEKPARTLIKIPKELLLAALAGNGVAFAKLLETIEGSSGSPLDIGHMAYGGIITFLGLVTGGIALIFNDWDSVRSARFMRYFAGLFSITCLLFICISALVEITGDALRRVESTAPPAPTASDPSPPPAHPPG
jgi:hypothetical protein